MAEEQGLFGTIEDTTFVWWGPLDQSQTCQSCNINDAEYTIMNQETGDFLDVYLCEDCKGRFDNAERGYVCVKAFYDAWKEHDPDYDADKTDEFVQDAVCGALAAGQKAEEEGVWDWITSGLQSWIMHSLLLIDIPSGGAFSRFVSTMTSNSMVNLIKDPITELVGGG